MSRVRAPFLVTLLVTVATTASALLAPPAGQVLEDFDIRTVGDQLVAREADYPELSSRLEARFGVPVRVSMDDFRNVPKTISPTRPARYLTPPSSDDALTVTRRFLADNSDLYGLSPAEIDSLEVDTDYVTAHQGWRTLWLQQRIDGIKVYGARVGATVVVDSGQLLRFNAGPVVGGLTHAATPAMPVEQAIFIAADRINEPFAPGDSLTLLETKPLNRQVFAQGHFNSKIATEPVYFPTANGARLAWYVVLDSRRYPAVYESIIDATTGELLLRSNATNYFVYEADAYEISPRDTPVRKTWELHETFTSPPSPIGWYDLISGETQSNNVWAHDDSAGCGGDGPFTEVPPQIPLYEFKFPIDLAREPDTYANGAMANLFVINNMIHDRLYNYGFDELAGNFQNDNFFFLPPGDGDNDRVDAQSQDARLCGARNNANFSTFDDGQNGKMQMYLWTGSPEKDGDLDADIIIHELGHGVSNRLVGGRNCVNGCALGSGNNQSRAMGESWGDLLAASYSDDDAVAEYSADNADGIRNARFSVSTWTLDDIGKVIGGCQVHADGEVWSRAMWAIRTEFVTAFGVATGSAKFERYIIDSLKLMPTVPSMLNARDAMIDSAVNLFEECLMWKGFLQGGMSEGASATPECPPRTVVENFTLPARCVCAPGAPSVTANSLRAARTGGTTSRWQFSSPETGKWNIHSTVTKRDIPTLWTVMGALVASPLTTSIVDTVGTFPVGYYQVYGADGCTGASEEPGP